MNRIRYKQKMFDVPDMDLQTFFSLHEPDLRPVLAAVDGKVSELKKAVRDNTTIRPITTQDPAGNAAAARLAIFMLLKAFYSAAGKNSVDSIHVDFSMDDAFYIRPEGRFTLDNDLLDQVKRKMERYRRQAWPIIKSRKPTREAIATFQKHGMHSKADLFKFRISGYVHLYSLGQFDDYFYGHMPPDCSYCPPFSLHLHENGFFLNLSDKPFEPASHSKLFSTLHQSSSWSQSLHCRGVADLNNHTCQDQGKSLVQIQEALQEKEIGKVAEQIAASPDKKLVMIAGPSSSSKTTFAHRLCTQLAALGKHPIPLSVDDYFNDRSTYPRNEDGSYNFEALECIDLELLNNHLLALLAGEEISVPSYNFQKGKREYHGHTLKMGPDDLLVIEGIHALNERMSYALPASAKFRIYISALSQLSIDEHNPVSSSDGRLLRRIVRDARCRGYTASETISMWPVVQKGEEDNINPFQENADIIFNSALVYELAVLKTFAEPLLFAIGREDPNFEEARRLLKFLDYFLAISSEWVPQNSLLREFIG